MQSVRDRALAAKVSLYTLSGLAGVSGTVITRWIKGKNTPSLVTIQKYQRKLDEIEKERAS